MRYKVILFDADETLFDFHRSERHAFAQTMQEFGFPYEESLFLPAYQEINTAIWKEFEEGRIAQKDLKVERFRRFAVRIGADFHPDDFAFAYETNLGAACFLLEGSEALVAALHRTHRLAIITNGLKRVQEVRIAQSPISHYFDAILISEVAGVSKPDPRIFDLVLSEIGHADRKSVLMVGDSLTSDIQGGINAGIDTCWYNPGKADAKPGIRPTYEIGALEELLQLVCG